MNDSIIAIEYWTEWLTILKNEGSDIYPFLGIRHSLLIHQWLDGRNKTTIILHEIFWSTQ